MTTRFASTLAVAAIVLFTGSFAAEAFQRSGTVSGTHGSFNTNANVSCAGGTCSRSVKRTGSNGYTQSHQGTVSYAGGTCNSQSSTTRRNGQTTSHTGSFTY